MRVRAFGGAVAVSDGPIVQGKIGEQLTVALVPVGVAVCLPLYLAWRKKPRLRIVLDEKQPIDTNVQCGNEKRDFFRVVVRNDGGEEVARNARVFLTAVHREQEGQWVRENFNDCMELGWAYWQAHTDPAHASRRDVVRGVDYYADLASWAHRGPNLALVFPLEQTKFVSRIFREGVYRFDLIAVADNAPPVRQSVRIRWRFDGSSAMALM